MKKNLINCTTRFGQWPQIPLRNSQRSCAGAHWILVLLVTLIFSESATAQAPPPPIVLQAHIDQNIGAQLPANLQFNDERGNAVQLGSYFGTKPLILDLVYLKCTDLCPMSLRHLVEGLNGIGMVAGKDFEVLVVSFDPTDTPAEARSAKEDYLRGYASEKRAGSDDGWHFLTGPADSIAQLTKVVGFHYAFDPQSQRFVHATGTMILTPQGRLSHYFYGVDHAPASLEASLQDAAAGHSTWTPDPQQQYCFAYNPLANPRTRTVTRILQAGGAVWLALLVGYIVMHLNVKRSLPKETQ